MSVDDNGEHSRRFSLEEARMRAREALRKSEFILSRAWGLLREPGAEWRQIQAEETTVPRLLLGYVAPLAAIPPVASLIGSYTFEATAAGDVGTAIIRAVMTWMVSVLLVYFLGFLINALADNFDGDKDELAAHKIAAYSMTPAFISGLFSLWPALWWLSLFALAAMVFLMYRGLPILMKAPEERALAYAATVTVAATVAFLVLFSLASCVA